MIGNNTIELNEATMIEIVQYWLANKFLNKDEPTPKVASFKAAPGSLTSSFKVELTQNQP